MAVKEALENATVVLINKTVTGIDTAVNFLSTEIPEVIKQLLMWNFTFNAIWALLLGILIFIGVPLAWWFANKLNKKVSDEFQLLPFVPAGFFTFITTIAIFPIFMDKFLMAVKIWIAPKVWLIEYAAELAKKVSN